MNHRMNSRTGFTLIELIVVIVILGILAVTAAPKFMNLTSDANASVVKGLAGSIRSAYQLAYAKSRLTFGNNGYSATWKNNYVVCAAEECQDAELTSDAWKGKPGFVYLTMKGYPYSGWDSNLPVINTIAGMLDIGVSWDDYKEFKSDGKAPPSSDWIIYGKQVDQTEYSMTFVPKSAPNDAKSGDNYSLTAADDSGTCGVLYNSGPANGPKITTPTIKVFVKGC